MPAVVPLLPMPGGDVNVVYGEVRLTGDDSNGGTFAGAGLAPTPSAPTVSNVGTGGSVAANTYYVVITISDGQGETPMSAQSSTTTSGGSSTITVNSPTNPNLFGSAWNVYIGTTSGGPYFLQGNGLTFGVNRSITVTPPTNTSQPPGVDYSQQDAAQIVYSDLAIDAGNAFLVTSAAHPFTSAHVGNGLQILGGTGFTVRNTYVKSVTAAGVATLAAIAGTTGSTGGSGRLGGAMATLGGLLATGHVTAASIVFLKYNASAYSISSTANVSGGRVNSTGGPSITGYDTTRSVVNTDDNRPKLQATGNSYTMVSLFSGGGNGFVREIVFDANGHTGITGCSLPNTGELIDYCRALGCDTGLIVGAQSNVTNSTADACTAYGIKVGDGGYIGGCTVTGMTASAGVCFDTGRHCLINACIAIGGASSQCVGFNSFASVIEYCTATDFTGANGVGYSLGGGGGGNPGMLVNDLAWNNTRNFVCVPLAITSMNVMQNCAGGAASQTNVGGFTDVALRSFVTLTANPFVNPGGIDYSLNSSPGGGALARGAGSPGTVYASSTVSTPNIGVAQVGSGGGLGPLAGFNLRGNFTN